MRTRDRILTNLEDLYRAEFTKASEAEDAEQMAELDFGFQRDQLYMEVLLDVRALLSAVPAESGESSTSLLEKAEALRRLTRLR